MGESLENVSFRMDSDFDRFTMALVGGWRSATSIPITPTIEVGEEVWVAVMREERQRRLPITSPKEEIKFCVIGMGVVGVEGGKMHTYVGAGRATF